MLLDPCLWLASLGHVHVNAYANNNSAVAAVILDNGWRCMILLNPAIALHI